MNQITRRKLTLSLITAGILSQFIDQLARSSSIARQLVGAIRWDAWYDPADGNVARAVERSLGPHEYHSRMPFFGQETGYDSVRINGKSQSVIDKEISYSRISGIDYWAFCSYPHGNSMNNALDLYLNSKFREDIGFCLISTLDSNLPYYISGRERLIALIAEPGYVKVLNDRPLLYLFSAPDDQIDREGGIVNVANWVQAIRSGVRLQGSGDPYIVILDANIARAAELCRILNLDGISQYATTGGPLGGAPYSTLVKHTEDVWDEMASTGLQVVPNIMTGWDTRPRQQNPVPWDHQRVPEKKENHFYQQARPEEIAGHISDALSWISKHPDVAVAETALVYAWNECDEGFGALVPSFLSDDPDGDSSRLRAVATVLRRR